MGKWEMVRLGDVAPAKSANFRDTKDKVWLLTLDMIESNTGNIIEYIYELAENIGNSTNKFDEQNVLYSKLRPYLNKVVLPQQQGFATSELITLRPKAHKLSREYLVCFLRSPSFVSFISEKVSGAKMPRVISFELFNTPIPLPLLDEQKRIAKNLDLASEIVKGYKEQLAELDKLVQSVFYEMFGESKTNLKKWHTKKLGEFADVGSSKRVFTHELVEHGVPFYRGTEVGALADGKTIRSALFITTQHYEILSKSSGVPTVGDLLMSSICSDGRIWKVDTKDSFYFKDGRVLWVHFRDKIVDCTYIQFALKEKFLTDYNNIASGTTFSELKIFALKNVEIMLPPLPLQTRFAEIVTSIEAQKAQVQQALTEAENLFNSLMQEYFA